MKKLILLVILFLSAKSFAQTNGITYQAVILNPSGEQLPGVNNTNAPMVGKDICLRFQFIDEFSNLEYQETIQTKTDTFGMVNLVIGSGNQTAGYAASFETIEWDALKKSLVVSINTSGSCSSFTEISNQPFTAVPFAFSAINAGNVTGVVDIQNGGTNAVTVEGAKTNLGLENVDNTNDLEKLISTATQNALNLNTDAITVEAKTARAAELLLRDDLATEATTARAAELLLRDDLATEAITARAAELVLTNNLATETTRAGLAEVANSIAISDEAARATDAEGVLTTAISDEAVRATDAEVANVDAILAEAVTARAAELANAASILVETSARTTSDGLQNTAISDNASAITAETSARTTSDGLQNTAISDNASAITAETSARTTSDGLQNTAITANASAITAETSARTTADGLQNTAIAANSSAITAETSARTTAITIETSARTTADGLQNTAIAANSSAITAETTARTDGDVANAGLISAETSARTTADGLQNTAITANASAISAETTARTDGDVANAGLISAETSARATADGLQNTAIAANASAITAETSARTTSDGLQNTAITDEAARAGLAEVANTTAIGLKEDKINKSIDGTFASNSDVLFPTEKATKTYVDAQVTTVTTGKFVDLTTDQTVAGDKTFSNNTIVNGTSIANSFKTPAGKSSQFLKADGSVDSNNYFLPNTSNIAIGYVAGTGGQGAHSIAIGSNVAQGAQAEGGVGLGYAAAQYSQGLNAVAIGSFAGNNGQHDNSIVINASGNSLNGNVNSGLYIDPIRSASGASSLFYDATTKEITYDTVAQNFVDLTTDQKVKGVKTFTSNGTFNGVTIGTGNATGGQNLAVGDGAMNGTSTGVRNTAIGFYSMHHYVGTYLDNNTSIGYYNLVSLTTGSGNTSVGAESMMALSTGTENTSLGNQSLINTTGNNNVGIGKRAGQTISSGSQNTIIGTNADVGTDSLNNATAIGYNAFVDKSNTIQLGNGSVTAVQLGTGTNVTLETGAVKLTGGTLAAGKVLTSDAYGLASWESPASAVGTSVTEVDDEFSATASQNSFTLTQTPSTMSKVKMYINGVRISNTAYSASTSTLTYVPVNNGGYVLTVGDRIQFDYFY
jgi:hypothetical protein